MCPISTEDLQGLVGVVFTGSGVAWSTEDPEAKPLRDAMNKVFSVALPVLGSCNGMQLAATVLGGSNKASPNGFEVGIARNIQLTEFGTEHPMLENRTEGYSVPAIHRDEVQSLPTGAKVLSSNEHSPVQSFVYEAGDVSFWGMQYHPEYPASHIGQLVATGTGIFTNHQHLAEDLSVVEKSESAAQRLGTSGPST